MSAASPILSPALSLRNISLNFEGLQLFENLSLEFAAGQNTCILGASGCGKSTLLKIIAGHFALPYSGEVILKKGAKCQKERENTAGNRSEYCAWMGQNDLLLPWFSALDNVLLGCKLRGEKSRETHCKAVSLLEAVGLADTQNSLPAALSGGMRQRAALARTLMEERPIMLMDEPFSALDALTRQKMQNLSAELTKNRTVLMVTHDPLEALRLADTIYVLGDSPARLIYSVELEGNTPRDAGDALVQECYQTLLSILLD